MGDRSSVAKITGATRARFFLKKKNSSRYEKRIRVFLKYLDLLALEKVRRRMTALKKSGAKLRKIVKLR